MPNASDSIPLKDSAGRSIPWLTLASNDHPIAPELAAAVAGVVIEWSVFEGALQAELSDLMKFPVVRRLSDDDPRSFKKKIELWKRAVHTLFPTVQAYCAVADEICSKGKIVAWHRNRLIHGHWIPPEGDGSEYKIMVIEGLERVRRFDQLIASVEHVTAVRNDIRALSNAMYGFMTNRYLHAHLGLLKVNYVPAPGHPAPNSPPKPEQS